jgi:Protein of unknown function (DUF2783)
MNRLLTEPRLVRADDLFEALANHIGDEAVVLEALAVARAAALE